MGMPSRRLRRWEPPARQRQSHGVPSPAAERRAQVRSSRAPQSKEVWGRRQRAAVGWRAAARPPLSTCGWSGAGAGGLPGVRGPPHPSLTLPALST